MIEFGSVRYDPESRILYRDDEEILLPPRVLAVLESLLKRPGKVVPKDDLLVSAWDGAFVEEASVTQAISELRQALGDDPQRPTYIQTIPRRGYRLIVEISRPLETDLAAEPAAPRQLGASSDPDPPTSGGVSPAKKGVLQPGFRLGRYEILERAGTGAMGEVWRARDHELDREVAVKLVPPDLATDSKAMARFRREARLLAAVDHPNVAAIHTVEEADGIRFTVMELVEGGILQDLLEHGPLSIKETLCLARQIAEGLEVAHKRGIVHRDLKPGNVAVNEEGRVKLLDFGLAKELQSANRDVTKGWPSLTKNGTLLGTAPYMSPEQARGQEVDERTDVWAFGCLLYEMLTGARAFDAGSGSDTLAAILTREPDWKLLPTATPPGVRVLLRRCLRKDPSHRVHHIADARIELEDALSHPKGPTRTEITTGTHTWKAAGLVAAGIFLGAVTALQFGDASSSASPRVRRQLVHVASDADLVRREAYPLALSPGGDRLAYVAERRGERLLFVHDLDQFQSRPLPGTEGARYPFFSHDGESLGFFASGQLQKVAVAGGMPQLVCEATPGPGATWGVDDTIYFVEADKPGIYRVDANGGIAEPLLSRDTVIDESRHRWPYALPDGRGLLSTVVGPAGDSEDSRLAVLSLATGEWRFLRYGNQGQILHGAQGQLLSSRVLTYHAGAGEIRLVPFDPASRELAGPPVSVLDDVYHPSLSGAFFAVSRSGSLVYVRGGFDRTLLRVDRRGEPTPLTNLMRGFRHPQVSPDGRYIALTVDPRPSEIWILDVAAGRLTKLADRGHNTLAVWHPDGRRVSFSSSRDGGPDLWIQPRDDTSAELLLKLPYPQFTHSWSHDGRLLLFDTIQPGATRSADIWASTLDSDPFHLLATDHAEAQPLLSPDGRWLAYVSDETGIVQVYVRAYPEMNRRQRISTNGGRRPVWSHEGTELFYMKNGELWRVPVDVGSTNPFGTPELLFTGSYDENDGFDVFPDSRSFVMVRGDPDLDVDRIRLVHNWLEEVKGQLHAGE